MPSAQKHVLYNPQAFCPAEENWKFHAFPGKAMELPIHSLSNQKSGFATFLKANS